MRRLQFIGLELLTVLSIMTHAAGLDMFTRRNRSCAAHNGHKSWWPLKRDAQNHGDDRSKTLSEQILILR